MIGMKLFLQMLLFLSTFFLALADHPDHIHILGNYLCCFDDRYKLDCIVFIYPGLYWLTNGLYSSLLISFASANLSPNEKLINCCHGDPQVDQYCGQKYCQIPQIAPHNVIPFILECAPRGHTVQKIWDCASTKHDHSECCRNQGVIPLCMPYCNAAGPVPTDMIKYGPCVGEFEKFRLCFRAYLKHHPSIRGDQ